jgi:hypothetical protein
MCDAGVLADLAEEVLAVNQLKRSSPQRLEFNAKSVEVVTGGVGDCTDNVRRRYVVRIGEALRDSVVRAGSGDYEVHLGEMEQLAVVEVDRELKRQEWPERVHTDQGLKQLAQARRVQQTIHRPVEEQLVQEP